MKVLHFIPSLKTVVCSELLKYKTALIEQMAESGEVCVLTADKGNISLGKAEIRTYSPVKTLFGRGKRQFGKILDAVRPEVVHIHACWNFSACCLLKACEKRNIPTVLTTDRQLEPWHVSRHYWSHKLPLMLKYQRYILKHAGALHATNRQELENISSLNWHPRLKTKHSLNPNIALIEPFTVVHGMKADNMTESMIKLYRKVADSSPFGQMTKEERHAEDLLMQAGISGDITDSAITEADKDLMASLNNDAWRRIFLHSTDQGIYEYVKAGLKKADIPACPIDTDKVERFIPESMKDTATKAEDIGKSRKISRLKSDETLSDFERKLCAALMTVSLKIKYSCVNRADFTKIYKMLRFNEYDEDAVENKMHDTGTGKNMARLLQIMKERYGLGDGFMFTEPLNDKKTTKIKKKLFNTAIQ